MNPLADAEPFARAENFVGGILEQRADLADVNQKRGAKVGNRVDGSDFRLVSHVDSNPPFSAA
jgi:hypothetical protein